MLANDPISEIENTSPYPKILNRPKEMNAVSSKYCYDFFLQSAHLPHPNRKGA
jgi:hypothetical protein